MQRSIVSYIILALGATPSGCSTLDEPFTKGTAEATQNIAELNCAFRPVSAPTSGATFASVPLSNCVGTRVASPSASYGYTNCKEAYIVDLLSIADNGSPSSFANRATFSLFVGPTTQPSTPSSCVDTSIRAWLYGTDSDGTTWNYGPVDANGNPLGVSVSGTWVLGGGLFPPRCVFGTRCTDPVLSC
jgi:hypothetical protein